MFKILKEDEEEMIRRAEEKEIEGEFYYMSTRYKSLIPLINEVKALRGEVEMIKSKVADTNQRVDKIAQYLKDNSSKGETNKEG